MGNSTSKRIKDEIRDIENSKIALKYGFGVKPINDIYTELRGYITGLPGTPYEGGQYTLEIKVPANYPLKPPTVRFITKIWHPKINLLTGGIDRDILEDSWTPIKTLQTILLSLTELFHVPSNYNSAVFKQYGKDYEMFRLTARYWAKVYAGASATFPEFDEKTKIFTEKGVGEHKARTILSLCSWDVKKADEILSV